MARGVKVARAVWAATIAFTLVALSTVPTAAARATATPRLGARAAALLEMTTGEQVYADDAEAKLPIASATKLMTALVTLHHAKLARIFSAPAFYPAPEDSQIGITPGERMSVHDLLIAMLLPSADDAAYDLAYNVGRGSIGRFVGLMNARARALGLRDTHYTTPIGLDTPGNYSSAHDLVVLARHLLLTEPFFRAVVRLPRAVLRTGNRARVVTNLNDLVARYPWINGVKTGHTLDAGYVLIASGTRDGMTLIGAVLGTPSEGARDAAALALLNYGFATYALRTPVRAGEVIGHAAVSGAPGKRVRLIAGATYTHVFPRSARVRLRIKAPAILTAPLPRHAVVGSIQVLAGRRIATRIPLLLAHALPRVEAAHRRHPSTLAVSVTLSGLVMAAGAAIGLRRFWRGSSRG